MAIGLSGEILHRHRVHFRHRRRRRAYHPAALGLLSDDSEAAHRGALFCTLLLWFLSIPFAGLLLLSLIFGSDLVIRALHAEGGSFLIPLLR